MDAPPAAARLAVPAELAGVNQRALKDFLLQYSRLFSEQFAPGLADTHLRAFVNDVLVGAGGDAAAAPAAPADLSLEFKHVCRFSGCNLEDCQLCRNNPNKVCEASTVLDKQYWVRDDGKGGQQIKARCGSDLAVQLIDRGSRQGVVLPGVSVRLYVVNGQPTAPPALTDSAGGLYLADDGHALFSAAGATVAEDGGVPLELAQDEVLGAVARVPEFQFLGKNSKFKSGGRAFKSFRVLARALHTDPLSGRTRVLAQVESESFKVTTKKGYDGCRKAEYLFAHQPITDKTFASLGETTISNLKNTFEGLETVEDLMRLVQASATDADLQSRLRDTLNMARDTDKWRKLTRMLSERVVWDDSTLRLFVIPTGSRPLGLIYRANKGQVDFDATVGVVYQPPLPSGQLRAVRASDRALAAGCAEHIVALKQLACSYWALNRHPGWTLVPEQPKWEHATAATITDAFAEVLGPGDPVAAAEAHWVQLAANLAAAQSGSAGPSPLRSPTPLSSDNPAAAVAALLAQADSGGLSAGGGAATAMAGGAWLNASAAAAAGGGGAGLGLRAGGRMGSVSPFEGSNAVITAAMAATATGGFQQQQQQLQQALGSMGRPAALTVPNNSAGMVMLSPAQAATSMHMSGRTTSNATEQTSDTSHSTPNNLQLQMLQQQQQMQQQQLLQMAPRAAQSLGLLPNNPGGLSAMQLAALGQPGRTVSGPMLGGGPGGQQSQRQRSLGLSVFGPSGAPSAAGGGAAAGAACGSAAALHQDPLLLSSLGLDSTPQGLVQSLGAGAAAAAPRNQGPFATMQQQQSQGLTMQQQQQGGQQAQQQQELSTAVSGNTMLLQQAIVEGWPAPHVKALLDNMSDAELHQLVELHAASDAVTTGSDGAAAAAAGGAAAGQGGSASAAALQGFGSSLSGPGAAGAAAGQQPGMMPPPQHTSGQQQQQTQQAATDTAAAAMAALFADAGSGQGVGDLRAMSDVQLTGDQGLGLGPAGLANLDSFTADMNQWGDLLHDLRNISGSSNNPPGSAMLLGPHNSFTTDWIPELLSKVGSGRFDPVAAAAAGAAAAAAGAGVATAGAGAGTSGNSSHLTAAAAAAAAAAAEAGEHDDVAVELEDKGGCKKGKRLRSKTGQAPSAEQRQEWQAMFGVDENAAVTEVRSLSKAETHFDSFNRHFPVARLTSKTAEVQQGGQVAYPWAPGQRLSATGVAHPSGVQPSSSPGSPNPFADQQQQPQQQQLPAGSPMVSSPGIQQATSPRPPVTTDSPHPGAAAAAGGAAGWQVGTPPATAPCAQTEEGAAALESLTGLRSGGLPQLEGGAEASGHSGGLRGILELMSSDAAAAAGGGQHVGAGGAAASGANNNMLLSSQRTDSDAAAVAAAAAADNPFAVAAAREMHPPAPQQLREASAHRDSMGRAGWITSLFRRSGSLSSGAVGSGGSGSGPSGGSHSSKDPATGLVLVQSGSVRGPEQ